jgi:hypothetical protein
MSVATRVLSRPSDPKEITMYFYSDFYPYSDPHCGTDSATTRRDRPSRASTQPSPAEDLFLQSIGGRVPLTEMDCPGAAAVVIEDLCWRLAIADADRRRPRFWRRREYDVWRAERKELAAARERIRTMADAIGLDPSRPADQPPTGQQDRRHDPRLTPECGQQ